MRLGVAGGRHVDGEGQDGGDLVGPNPTDRGKNGVKRSLLVEKDGGPLAVAIAGANVPDVQLLAATIDAVVDIEDMKHLQRILGNLRKIPGVRDVQRVQRV